MSQSLSPKGKKVFDYFVANPTANASKVAAKFLVVPLVQTRIPFGIASTSSSYASVFGSRLTPLLPRIHFETAYQSLCL